MIVTGIDRGACAAFVQVCVFFTAVPITCASVCVFITAGPITKLCAWGEEDSGGHVL